MQRTMQKGQPRQAAPFFMPATNFATGCVRTGMAGHPLPYYLFCRYNCWCRSRSRRCCSRCRCTWHVQRERFQAQHAAAVLADTVSQCRVAVQLLTVRWNHFQHFRLPFWGRQTVFKRFLQHFDHDRWRGRGTWRCTQQCHDAAIAGTDNFRTELQQATFYRIILDDLYALTGVLQGPVFHFRVRQVFAQGLQAVFRRIHHLLDQVFGQWNIVVASLQHRTHVASTDRGWQVDPRTVFQELGREGSEWAKQQRALAIDDTGIEMRHGHRWRTYRSFAVDFGVVLVDQLRIGGDQPLAADRYAAVAFGFRNAGFFQQRQCTTASANEDELGTYVLFLAVSQVFHFHVPYAIGATLDVFHLITQVQFHTVFFGQVLHQAAGQRAIVDVGTDFHAGSGNLLVLVAAIHDQRRPLLDLRVIFAVQHALEQVFLLQSSVALAQEVDIVVAPHKAHMRYVVDEAAWIAQVFMRHFIGPELLGNLELLVDLNGFLGFHVAVGRFWRVVQFHERGVAGTGVVHCVRAFGRNRIEALIHGNGQRWIQFLEHAAQGSAHGARANQQHIDRFFRRRRWRLVTCRQNQARHQK